MIDNFGFTTKSTKVAKGMQQLISNKLRGLRVLRGEEFGMELK
jgi:hypothetical protein